MTKPTEPSTASTHDPEAEPVGSLRELIDHFQHGAKSRDRFRIGLEHEKVGVALDAEAPGGIRALPYEDAPGKPQIRVLLHELTHLGWQPIEEDGNIIALRRRGDSVTLEPGGQFELSGAPFGDAMGGVRDLDEHLAELLPLAERLGIAFLSAGFRPLSTFADVPWMPKGRYRVMREYLPTKGKLGIEMMKRTATAQVNLDYESEADAMDKMRLGHGLAALVTALYAASPLVDGKPSGYKSFRAACWLDTDNQRCGILPFLFQERAGFRDYAEWALDVPMFFVYRDHAYQPVWNFPFRQFMKEGWHGHRATLADWDLHLSTLFPEARLRQYVETRSADSGPLPYVRALPCLWRGLFYAGEARRAAWDLVKGFSLEEREALRRDVTRVGMAATVAGREVGALCAELVEIAALGLSQLGATEEQALLEPLRQGAAERRAPADEMLEIFAAAKGEPAAFVEKIRYRM